MKQKKQKNKIISKTINISFIKDKKGINEVHPKCQTKKFNIWRCIFISKYLSEFKLKVIEDMMGSKESIYGIARKYNLNELIVRMWFRRYELQGAKELKAN